MFSSTSRYYDLPVAEISTTARDGSIRSVRYVRRRFIPKAAGILEQEHTVIEGDRLDNLTAQYLGDPTYFWRICDGNQVMNPFELLRQPGDTVTIATVFTNSEE